MPMTYPSSEAEWLALRHQNVSSTESAALLGLGDYQTPYELGLEKQAKEPPKSTLDGVKRVIWGKRLQEVIAKGISDDYGVKVRRVNGYATHPDVRLGASFDYEVVGIKEETDGKVDDIILQQMYRDLGPGVLEIKNVDGFVFSRRWKTEDNDLEAPPQIEIQLQHQLEAIQTRKWGVIGVLVGGNDQYLLVRERQEDFGERLRNVIAEFWVNLEAGKLPPITLPGDIEIIRKIYLGTTGGKVYTPKDEAEEKEMADWCRQYIECADLAKVHEQARKTLGARILERIQDAEFASLFGWKVRTSTVSETMVPAHKRNGYRKLTVAPMAVKGAA